jgi:hypothetical protein
MKAVLAGVDLHAIFKLLARNSGFFSLFQGKKIVFARQNLNPSKSQEF